MPTMQRPRSISSATSSASTTANVCTQCWATCRPPSMSGTWQQINLSSCPNLLDHHSGRVFRYGISTGRAERDVASDLRGALKTVKVKHHASITEPKAIGALMRAIRGYEGEPITQVALRLAPLVFVRP